MVYVQKQIQEGVLNTALLLVYQLSFSHLNMSFWTERLGFLTRAHLRSLLPVVTWETECAQVWCVSCMSLSSSRSCFVLTPSLACLAVAQLVLDKDRSSAKVHICHHHLFSPPFSSSLSFLCTVFSGHNIFEHSHLGSTKAFLLIKSCCLCWSLQRGQKVIGGAKL